MGQIIKVKDVGEEWIAKIYGADIVSGQYGEQVQFVDEHGDTLYMPLDSAQRQLQRLEMDVETLNHAAKQRAVWLKFYRTPSTRPGGSPFWNIALAGGSKAVAQGARPGASQPPNSRQAPPPPSTPDRAPQRQPGGATGQSDTTGTSLGDYLQALDGVGDEVVRRWKAMGASYTAADCNAATATILIRSKELGIPISASVRGEAFEAPEPSDADYPGDYDDTGDDR
jgi:hypothetical protein